MMKMDMSCHSNRARDLYEQCLQAYQSSSRGFQASLELDGKSIPLPNCFDNGYNVPAELLFFELFHSKRDFIKYKSEFQKNLLFSVYANSDFNIELLTKIAKDDATPRTYRIYMEVYFLKSRNAKLPFEQDLTIDSVCFSWCQKDELTKLLLKHKDEFYPSNEGSLHPCRHLRAQMFKTLPKSTNSNIYPIAATVKARDVDQATNLVLAAFETLSNCLNLSQSLGSYYFESHGGFSKPRIAFTHTGFLVATSIGEFECFNIINDVQIVPSVRLNFMGLPNRLDFFKLLLQACSGTAAICSRIRNVANELVNAATAESAGHRQLIYWRCLEVATARSDSNRTERDIISIFKKYRPSNLTWQQMGQLILKARNDYVHRGTLPTSDDSLDYYLNWSQEYAECALKILIYLYKKKDIWRTNQQIDDFFDYYSKSNESLSLAKQLLEERQNHI